MLTRTLQVLAGSAIAAALLLAAWPQLAGVERAAGFAQAVSLRGAAVLLAVVGLVMLAAAAVFLNRVRRFIAAIAVLLAVFSMSNAAVLTARGLGSVPLAFGSTLTVLSWNTMGDAPGPEAIAELAITNGASIVALPETTSETAGEVARLMAAAGKPMTWHTVARDHISKARSTSLLISASLGEYAIDATAGDTSLLPSLVAKPVNRNGPTIVAVHAVSPVNANMQNWRDDLSWLEDHCERGNVILAGDFNATVDHLFTRGTGAFDDCSDAALEYNSGAVGTWPALVPPWMGSPIDHVLFSGEWRVTGMRVVTDHDHAGSDHRPILAWLAPAPDTIRAPIVPKTR